MSRNRKPPKPFKSERIVNMPDTIFDKKMPQVYIVNPAKLPFADSDPPQCSRKCEKFYESHGKTISFALYAPRGVETKKICAYAFSCGDEIQGAKFELQPGEKPEDILYRVVPVLIQHFQLMALNLDERDDTNG